MHPFFLKIKQLIWQDQWNIAILKTDKQTFLKGKINSDQIQWLFPEKKSRIYADPFLVEYQSKKYIFFEEYDYSSCKGVISVSEVTFDEKKFHSTKPKKVIEESFHLSYPFIFQKEGKWMMIPETSGAGQQCLYEAVDFPLKWIKCKPLIENIFILDPTIFEHESITWMFCSSLKKGKNSKLDAFFFDENKKAWTQHHCNPIVVGLASARPAGAVFRIGEKIYRPGQNCLGTYGRSIVINEILELTPDIYKEKKIAEIKADDFPVYKQGTHTLNFGTDWAVFDGKRTVGPKKLLDPFYSKYLKKN
jgi:hypothetical protein